MVKPVGPTGPETTVAIAEVVGTSPQGRPDVIAIARLDRTRQPRLERMRIVRPAPAEYRFDLKMLLPTKGLDQTCDAAGDPAPHLPDHDLLVLSHPHRARCPDTVTTASGLVMQQRGQGVAHHRRQRLAERPRDM